MMVSHVAWIYLNVSREILHKLFTMLSISAYKIPMTYHKFERCLSCNHSKSKGVKVDSVQGTYIV